MAKNTSKNATFGAKRAEQHADGVPENMAGQNVQIPPYAQLGGSVSAGNLGNYARQASNGTANVLMSNTPKQPKRKRPKSFWVAIIIAVIAILACAALVFFMFSQEQLGIRDPNSAAGQLEGKTAEEVQAELNRVVEEGMFNISIASSVQFEDGTSEGELKIENVPGNRYLMQVDITRDDTGETIYSSGILEPNYHIQSAPLDVDLDAGTYSCTAVFHALDPETEQEIGEAAAKMSVTILN